MKLFPVIFLILCGCGNQNDTAIVEAQEQSEWLLKYAALTNRFTERTYGCISEMYSLAYHPVNSGPVCKESCELHRQVNEMVANAPSYVVQPEQYKLPENEACKIKGKPGRAERKEGAK